MELHTILKQQLDQIEFDANKLPNSSDNWPKFISEVNQTYITLNKQLSVAGHQASMSETATTLLHNIGNILNSVNVSVNMLLENLSNNHHQKLSQITSLLKENSSDLNTYLTQDAKGKLIPEYLIKLADILINDNQKCNEEIKTVNRNIKAIKDIVDMQQCLSGMPGFIDQLFLPEVVETAIKMAISAKEIHRINVKKQYLTKSFIAADKSKILQILTNLIKNAKDAVFSSTFDPSKEIEVIVEENNEEFTISVIDNGVGISSKNLEKIFSFGFTSKETGHGFGLHSAMISAKEMGGAIKAHSNGLEKGATFSLILPKIPMVKCEGGSNG